MNRDRRGFMAHLKRIYKEDREPEIKELRSELKKRRMEFYTRDDGRKTLVIVQKSSRWRKSKSPHGREWPDFFATWNDYKEDRYETLLVWSELLGGDPEATADLLKDFATDDEEEESEGLPYIR